MTCDRCGGEVPGGCGCLNQDLMGFLSDFRAAAATENAARRDATLSPRRARVPAVQAKPELNWAPPVDAEWTPPSDSPEWTAPSDPDPFGAVPTWPPPGSPYPPPQQHPYQPSAQRRRPPIWAIGAVVAALALLIGGGAFFVLKPSASLGGLTADQVMQKMLAAAHHARTAHVEIAQSQGGATVRGVMDISPGGGTMSLTATGASGDLQAVAIGDSLYINGSSDLLGLMGFQDSIASQYADQWVSVPTDSPDVRQLAEELQTNVVVDDLLHLSGPLTRLPGTHGSLVALTGKVPENEYNDGSGAGDAATLTVPNDAPFVPASISYSDPDNGTTSMSFSRWGEHVDLASPAAPVPLPSGSTSSVGASSQVTTTSSQPGVAVTTDEATTVATELWQEWTQARSQRNISELQALDTQPELSADNGYACDLGCPAPPVLSLQSISVTVTQQSSWPAVIFATASYVTDCDAGASPCQNTFVAVQPNPHAAWKIALMASWSGSAYSTIPPVPQESFSPTVQLPGAEHLDTLPQEYATYLKAVKDTGRPPSETRLAPGAFTTGLVDTNYQPNQTGAIHSVNYTVSPIDPVWHFPGSDGTIATCGTVHYVDQVKATPGHELLQSADHHQWGNLAPGIYSAITLTGLHMACFESLSDPTVPVDVIGTWGDVVSVIGTATSQVVNPA